MPNTKEKWERPESARVQQLFEDNAFKARPNLVHTTDVTPELFCSLCSKIMIQPMTSPCNGRACKDCIIKCFEGKNRIECPFKDHEACQQGVLLYKDIQPDYRLFRFMLGSKSHCVNQSYGCDFQSFWQKTVEHQKLCVFQKVPCSNDRCEEEICCKDEREHAEACKYGTTTCPGCSLIYPTHLAQEHAKVCEEGEKICNSCGTSFQQHLQLTVHENTHVSCLKEAGKCFYYNYCKFESNNLEELKKHMKQKEAVHLHAVTAVTLRLGRILPCMKEEWSMAVRKQVLGLIKPIERELLGNAMKLKREEKKIADLTETVDILITEAADYKRDDKVEVMNKQIEEMQSDMRTGHKADPQPIEGALNYIEKHVKLVQKIKELTKKPRIISCDGTMLWKVANYEKHKTESVQNENSFRISENFFTSPYGYRMICKAYLHGNGGGRGTHLSLFLVLIKSEYDDIHRFPFSRKIKLTLLCPSDRTRNIIHTIESGASTNSFARPSEEHSDPVGFECFAEHATVESSDYLVEDSLFIEVSVEQGNDFIRGVKE